MVNVVPVCLFFNVKICFTHAFFTGPTSLFDKKYTESAILNKDAENPLKFTSVRRLIKFPKQVP